MKKKGGWRYRFADDVEVDLPLVESEKAILRDMARRLESPASTPEMKESGEEILNQLAELLAAARAAKIGSKVGTLKRLEAGDHKAALVAERIAKGGDPLELTSERNLNRIKNRKKK